MKKIFVISTIMAFIVASLSAFSVFAATASTSQTETRERIGGQQLKDLQVDRAFYDHFRTDRKNFVSPSNPHQLQQDLARYAFALKKAETIIAGRGNALVTSTSNNAFDNLDQTAQQNLAVYLHMMRDLRVKIGQDS